MEFDELLSIDYKEIVEITLDKRTRISQNKAVEANQNEKYLNPILSGGGTILSYIQNLFQ